MLAEALTETAVRLQAERVADDQHHGPAGQLPGNPLPLPEGLRVDQPGAKARFEKAEGRDDDIEHQPERAHLTVYRVVPAGPRGFGEDGQIEVISPA